MSLPGADCWAECDGVGFCLLESRILSCLATVGSSGDILKSACKCFLDGAVGNIFKLGVGGTSG